MNETCIFRQQEKTETSMLPSCNDVFGALELTMNDSSTRSPLDDVNMLRHIISFVGSHQYRFVAAVNRDWKEVYLQLFPDHNCETYLSASTISHVKVCYDEVKNKGRILLFLLCESAVRRNNVAALKYIRYNHFGWDHYALKESHKLSRRNIVQWMYGKDPSLWDSFSGTEAARKGHLLVLQWLHMNQCPLHFTECRRYAQQNGHPHIVKWILQTDTSQPLRLPVQQRRHHHQKQQRRRRRRSHRTQL